MKEEPKRKKLDRRGGAHRPDGYHKLPVCVEQKMRITAGNLARSGADASFGNHSAGKCDRVGGN